MNKRTPKNLWLNFRKGQRFLFTPKNNTDSGVHQGARGPFSWRWRSRDAKLTNRLHLCVISGFRHDVDENYSLLGCYATWNSNSSPTFRGNLSVPSPTVKKSRRLSRFLKLRPIGCPETSVRNYHSTLWNMPEECISQYRLVLRLRMSRAVQALTCTSSWNSQEQICLYLQLHSPNCVVYPALSVRWVRKMNY